MKIRIGAYVFLIMLVLVVQTTVLDYFSIYNIKPNLILIFILCVAVLRGGIEGAVTGLFAGIVQDMVMGEVLGFYSLLGFYAGYLAGISNKNLYKENSIIIIFFTIIGTLLYEWLVYFLITFFDTDSTFQIAQPILTTIIPEALYNSFVAVFIYAFMIKLNHRLVEYEE